MKNERTFGYLFDWDGVVIDSHAQHEASWHLLAEELGTEVPEGFFQRTFGMRNQQIIPQWFPGISAEEVLRRGDRKEELYREILRRDGIEPLPGVREFLEEARACGVPCAIGTSTPKKNIETVMEMTGLQGLFQGLVTAEDVERGKPDPDVFLKGAAQIRRAPERCVVFEDAFVGIEAGLAGGMKVVAIATTNRIETLGRAHLAVKSHLELHPLRLAQQLGLE